MRMPGCRRSTILLASSEETPSALTGYFERMIADPTMRPEAISYASAVAEGADPAAARMDN